MTIPKIVEYLPDHRERILKARFRTQIVDELCRDYEFVRTALEADPSKQDRDDLIRLARDLELELLDWLSAHGEDSRDQ